MGDVKRDWKFKLNPYLWPVLMFLSFLAAMVTMPKGLAFAPWEEHWYAFNACAVLMVVFWSLWVRRDVLGVHERHDAERGRGPD